MQPVVVPGDDGVECTVLDRRQHFVVGLPLLAAVGLPVVVLEVVRDLPVAGGAESLAVDALTLDAGTLALGSQEIRVYMAARMTCGVWLGRVGMANLLSEE